MSQKSKLINYVQYLRAFALFIAFFYHLEINFFKNGYLGLDIFFVISGFVITKMLLDSYYFNSKINLYSFYKKRFKRIYPVLFFFLIIALLVIIILSPLDLFLERFNVIFFAFFGLSNFYYIFRDQDYFDTIFIDPLNHTWSLGVEEQFYLVFPFFLSSLLILFKGNIKKIGIIFLLLIFIGVFFTYIYQENSKLIFYSPLFRFWEFLLGGFVLLGTYLVKKNNIHYCIISLLLIIFVVFSGNFITNFQKIFSISFLVSILLFFCDDKYLIKNKIIHNFIIYIAEISYSFYLWHLLIIYFYKLYFGIDIFGIIFIFLTTLVLSSFSFKFVEQKFRYMKKVDRFPKKYFYTISVFFLISTVSVFYVSHGKSKTNELKAFFKNNVYKLNFLEQKFNYTERTVFYKFKINNNEIYSYCTANNKVFNKTEVGLRKECLKNNNKKKLFFIIGNSHTANFIPMFNNLSDEINFYYSHSKDLIYEEYVLKLNKLTNEYNEIILTTNISTIKDLDDFFEIFSGLKQNIKILIIGPIPNLPATLEPIKCLIQKINCSYNIKEDFKKRNIKDLNELIINKIALKDREIFFYKPYKHLCPEDLCYVYNKKVDFLTHRDDSHLTKEGSLSLRDHFLIFYKNNFN